MAIINFQRSCELCLIEMGFKEESKEVKNAETMSTPIEMSRLGNHLTYHTDIWNPGYTFDRKERK